MIDTDPETREALEAQREFLLRSLDDLEAERTAGNIDDGTYERLHGDYTARAATVLRALDGEAVEQPGGPPPVSAGRRALVIGGLVAFAVAAAVVLAITIAPRQPGQTITGGAPVTGPKAEATLKAAVHDHPDDYSARIAYARSLLATDQVGALEQYGAAAKLDPKQPEPPTYIGWIFGLASAQVTDAASRTQLLDRSLSELALARSIDPKYPDAYVFEGLVRYRYAKDPTGAIPLLKEYLRLSPDGPQVSLVQGALKDAQQAAEAATTTTTR
jgi:hypothetical protein